MVKRIMSDQPIIIVEQDVEFAPLLKSALDSYGYNDIAVVTEVDESEPDAIILYADSEFFLQKPLIFGRLLQNLDILINRDENASFLELGAFSLDIIANILVKPSGEHIKITDKERDILLYLHEQSPDTVKRQDLLEQVWGYGENINTHTLETHIYRLRQKIEENASEPQFLKTEDDGYKLEI